MNIQRGGCEGCVLLPILFNLYSDDTVNEALGYENKGIKINGITINNLKTQYF